MKLTRSAKSLSMLLVLVLVVVSAQPASATIVYPNSIAALGDSITTAYNTGSAFADAKGNSWSTGTNTSVNSFYSRILASKLTAISGQNFNYAVSGAKMVNLDGQAGNLNSSTEYVTILMGGNDVCTSSESTMTSVATFQLQFQTAMQTITRNAPNARIYVVSIPNVYNLWSVLKGNGSARFAWAIYRICQSMLANPTSTKSADVARRARVLQRNIDFNTVLKQVCEVTYASRCTFDNNDVFNTVFKPSDISTRDYFHPSLAGQTKLADVAWKASDLAP